MGSTFDNGCTVAVDVAKVQVCNTKHLEAVNLRVTRDVPELNASRAP